MISFDRPFCVHVFKTYISNQKHSKSQFIKNIIARGRLPDNGKNTCIDVGVKKRYDEKNEAAIPGTNLNRGRQT
jgi:hypothetical protein